MRLKPAGIFAIVLVIAVLAYLAFKPKLSGADKTTTETSATAPNRDTSSTKKIQLPPLPQTAKAMNGASIIPPKNL